MLAGVSRRTLLAGLSCLLVGRAAGAHTPYKQWQVYRRRHLLIGTCRADPESYPLGKRLAAILASEVPESEAKVTRAPNQQRLASLITTGQLELVVLTFGEAVALASGNEPFAEFDPYPLRLVFQLDGYGLVCGKEFPARHAWLVTRALAQRLPVSNGLAAPDDSGLAVHEGSRAYLAGAPQPD
jgi:hypothetical protein